MFTAFGIRTMNVGEVYNESYKGKPEWIIGNWIDLLLVNGAKTRPSFCVKRKITGRVKVYIHRGVSSG